MSTLLVVSGAPYGSECLYDASRPAEALAPRDEAVTLLLMGDAARAARAGQDPQAAYASFDGLLTGLLEHGVEVTSCGTRVFF
jgi:sulfur relay (sulfurtransferase) complex TusBCD TusD component (DsrE family)